MKVKCPECGSTKLWDTGASPASDYSFVDVSFECQVCRNLFDVDYRPKGYSHAD